MATSGSTRDSPAAIGKNICALPALPQDRRAAPTVYARYGPLAVGRRLRRTYAWIFVIQAISYYGKLAIHPAPQTSFTDVLERAAIGPIPGSLVIAVGVLFHGGWVVFAIVTLRMEIASRRERGSLIAMG